MPGDSRRALDIVPNEDLERLNQALYASAESLSTFQRTGQFQTPAGKCWLQFSAAPRPSDDQSACRTGLALDATDQKQSAIHVQELNRELKLQAEWDYLTGLSNRRKFTFEVKREPARFDRHGERFCFALLGLDRFKRINDEHGRDFGDLVPKRFSEVLCRNIRKPDVPARVGGEFGRLFPDTALEDSRSVCERIPASLRTPDRCSPRTAAGSYAAAASASRKSARAIAIRICTGGRMNCFMPRNAGTAIAS